MFGNKRFPIQNWKERYEKGQTLSYNICMNHIYNILKEIRPDSDFEHSDDYIEDYLLDSFDVLKFISQLEQIYKIKFLPEDIVSGNFCNIEKIVGLLGNYGVQLQGE